MYRLANHQAPMKAESQHNRVELERSACHIRAQRDIIQDPAIVNPVCHHRVLDQRCRNGRAFEVFALSRRVLGEGLDSNVEARETR